MKSCLKHILAASLVFLSVNTNAVEPLKGPNCIPVKSLAEDKLAFVGGGKVGFRHPLQVEGHQFRRGESLCEA